MKNGGLLMVVALTALVLYFGAPAAIVQWSPQEIQELDIKDGNLIEGADSGTMYWVGQVYLNDPGDNDILWFVDKDAGGSKYPSRYKGGILLDYTPVKSVYPLRDLQLYYAEAWYTKRVHVPAYRIGAISEWTTTITFQPGRMKEDRRWYMSTAPVVRTLGAGDRHRVEVPLPGVSEKAIVQLRSFDNVGVKEDLGGGNWAAILDPDGNVHIYPADLLRDRVNNAAKLLAVYSSYRDFWDAVIAPEDAFFVHMEEEPIDAWDGFKDIRLSEDRLQLELTMGYITAEVYMFIPFSYTDTRPVLGHTEAAPEIVSVKPSPIVLAPGEVRIVEVTVKNNGDKGTVYITVEGASEHMNTVVGHASVTLDRGETRTVRLKVMAGNADKTAPVWVDIRAASADGTNTDSYRLAGYVDPSRETDSTTTDKPPTETASEPPYWAIILGVCIVVAAYILYRGWRR